MNNDIDAVDKNNMSYDYYSRAFDKNFPSTMTLGSNQTVGMTNPKLLPLNDKVRDLRKYEEKGES